MSNEKRKHSEWLKKYTPELIEKAWDYVDNWKEHDKIPQIVGLALHCGIGETSAHNWKKDPKKAEWAHICQLVMAMQQRELANRGLIREFDSGLAKLFLTHNHGMDDKKVVDLANPDGSLKPSVIEIVAPEVSNNE